MARIFVGVAWPYANGPFHIGQLAGAFLPADIFARYHRLRDDEVLMVSGSDMHGTPILVTAEKQGESPSAVSARFHEVNRRSFERLGFTFDVFTHTHTILHERTVQEVFLTLLSNGFISRRTEENAYCPKHARFLPDRYLKGTCPHCGFDNARGDECDQCGRVLEPRQLKRPRCSLCDSPAEFRPSEHFYLRLDALAPALSSYLSDKSFWRPNVLNVTRHFLEGGLHETPITRDLDWGIPIPLEGYDSKRFYVWFEAVIGYLSASREWAVRAGRPQAWRKYWDPNEPARAYYFIGKDNVFFHTITWPGILIGHRDLRLPHDVPANEWMLVEGRKVSKSRASDATVFLPSLLDNFAPDVIRFYAAQMAPQNHDTEFDWDEFVQLSDYVLSNQYGNLVQRLLVLTRERFGGQVPEPSDGWRADADGGIGAHLREVHSAITRELEAVRLKEALDLALTEVREANRRFHEAKPWQSPDSERRTAVVESLWTVKAAAIWLAPFLPFSSAEVFRMLGYAHAPGAGDWDHALVPVRPGQALGEVRPLFPRRESTARVAAASPAPAAPPPAAASPPTAALPPLALRAAVVTRVEPHPGADKLYVVTLDLGAGASRTVVAGLRPFYAPDELAGRHVVLLANLEPRTIRKVTSHGMVLAAESGESVRLLLAPEGVPAGAVATVGRDDAPVVRFEDFARTPIVVGIVSEIVEGKGSRIDLGNGRAVLAPGRWAPGDRVVVRLPSEGSERGEVLAFGETAPIGVDASMPAGAKVR